MSSTLDIIVFGATGYTGKYTLPQVYKLSKENGKELTWGIAGRSEQKLKQILDETSKRIGVDNLSDIPIIIADVSDEGSILQMTARAKTIINCCGPYQQYGEVVVKSCIETGTHYVDVSGESYFQETIEAKYHEAAEKKGVYIVSSCGFDSVASEMGLAFLDNKFQGTLNSVEVYISRKTAENVQRPVIHYGTWESAVNGIGLFRSLSALRKNINLKPLPKMQPKLSRRCPFSKASAVDKPDSMTIPFPSPDADVIKRSQRYFYENDQKRPIQVSFYVLVQSWCSTLLVLLGGLVIVALSQFNVGRKLLLKYPECFTAGYISHVDPTEETINKSGFELRFYGEGWKDKLAEGQDQYKTQPNKSILGQVIVTNPGYGFTCVAVTLAAIMILTETSQMPKKGGVYTPAVAFSKTSFVEQLQKNGTSMEILKMKDI